VLPIGEKTLRVHELAAQIGTSNDALGDFLEGLGEKRSHLAGVSPEADALAREHFAGQQLDALIYADEMTTFEAFAAAAHQMPLSLDGEVREIDPPPIDPDLPGAACEYEAVGFNNTIPLLADNGAHRGTLCLDPGTAEKLRAALKGRSVADATLLPERGELVAVTWPCYQKIVVRTQ
jgi:hypothetical protein